MTNPIGKGKDQFGQSNGSQSSSHCESEVIYFAYQRLQQLQQEVLRSDQISAEVLVERIQEFSQNIEEIWVTLEEQIQNYKQDPQSDRYRQLFDCAPDAYVVTDAYGAILTVNQAACDLFNLSKTFLTYKPLVMFIPESDRHDFRTCLARLDPCCSPGEWRFWIRPYKRETVIPVAITLSILPDAQGGITEIRWLIRDLSQNTQRDDLPEHAMVAEREFNQLRSQFIETVSHEFRTPLSVLKTAVELLEQTQVNPLTERQQTLFRMARRSIDTMTQMIDDVLIFSREERGKPELHPTQFSLESFCDQIVEEHCLDQGSSHRIQLNMQGETLLVFTDPSLLRQILNNLISNALKYSAHDAPVQVQITQTAHSLQMGVSDQGIGIPPQEQGRLFEPFHRCQNASQIVGTGLGLAIVKRAVDRLGGQIEVESQLGQGTTVTVTLPLICDVSLDQGALEGIPLDVQNTP